MRRFLGNEKGEGRIGVLLAIILVISAAYAAYVLVPIRIKAYEFLDTMRQEARFGAVNKKDNVVHTRLMRKAKQIGIPLKPSHLKVAREGGTYVITAEYKIPVDLMVYKTDWVYEQRATAPIF